MTPDDLIVMDYLVHLEGNEVEKDSWKRIRAKLLELAHGKEMGSASNGD